MGLFDRIRKRREPETPAAPAPPRKRPLRDRAAKFVIEKLAEGVQDKRVLGAFILVTLFVVYLIWGLPKAG